MFFSPNRNNCPSINIDELDNLLGRINLIDIREDYEFDNGHVPTARNIPMGMLLSEPERYLNKSRKYYIICQSGVRSLRVCANLSARGYNVVNVLGGTSSYHGSLKR